MESIAVPDMHAASVQPRGSRGSAQRQAPEAEESLRGVRAGWPDRGKAVGDRREIANMGANASLRGLDLLSIRLVVLCNELRCLSAAARACHISLSAASHRLTNLEHALNRRLFARSHLGVQPTQAGTVLATHGLSVLLALDSAECQLKSLLVDPLDCV